METVGMVLIILVLLAWSSLSDRRRRRAGARYAEERAVEIATWPLLTPEDAVTAAGCANIYETPNRKLYENALGLARIGVISITDDGAVGPGTVGEKQELHGSFIWARLGGPDPESPQFRHWLLNPHALHEGIPPRGSAPAVYTLACTKGLEW